MTKKNGIAKSAILVTCMMFCFKIIGFIKQAIIGYTYGATIETDSYFIAWGFVSGISEAIVKALLVSLVAIYTNVRIKTNKSKANNLINGLLELLLPIFLILIGGLVFFAPSIVTVLAPSYTGDNFNRLADFIRILSPILLFGCLELTFGAILDSYKSFFIPRLQSLIYSFAVIIACFSLASSMGINALIVAQYASSLLFALILCFSIRRYHEFSLVRIRAIPELKSIITTAIPLFIGNSALQINQIVDKSITSGLGEGAASALSYCHTLEQFVTNIMIVNIGNVMFANFAEFIAKGEKKQVQETLKTAINILICLLFGVSIITIICSEDIVSIVYYRGSFSHNAVIQTSVALTGYALSFVAVAVRDLSTKCLYAFKDTKHPMISSIFSIIINIALSITLSKSLGIFGVALATSVSAVIGMVINAGFLKQKINEYRYMEHLLLFFRIVPAGFFMGIVVWGIHSYCSFGHLTMFIGTTIVGFAIYFLILYFENIQEIQIAYKMVYYKLRRNI